MKAPPVVQSFAIVRNHGWHAKLRSVLSPSLGQIPHPVTFSHLRTVRPHPNPRLRAPSAAGVIVLPDPEGCAHRRSYRSKDATQFQTSEDLRSEHPTLWRRRRQKRREPFVTCGFWNFKAIANTPYGLQSAGLSVPAAGYRAPYPVLPVKVCCTEHIADTVGAWGTRTPSFTVLVRS